MIKRKREEKEANLWYTVPGEIIKSEVYDFDFDDANSFVSRIVYKYTVDKKTI